MLEPGGEPDLPEEPVGTDRRGQRRVQHLERDRAVVPEVPREVHHGHPAAAELALDPVAVRQTALELLAQVGHSGHPCHPERSEGSADACE